VTTVVTLALNSPIDGVAMADLFAKTGIDAQRIAISGTTRIVDVERLCADSRASLDR